MLKTPVAFLIFNRPKNTQRVFNAIRKAKPAKLLVVADGHRLDRSGEAEKCAAARAVIDRVDWNCEVLTNYATVNMGCRDRNWVKLLVKTRRLIETVIGQLDKRFARQTIRARDVWHLTNRISRKLYCS